MSNLKHVIKRFLISLFGFHNFLLFTAIFRILTLRFKPREKDFFHFLSLIPSDSTILDVGANIGYKSYFFSKVPGSNVFSFEPITDNNKVLNTIKKLFKLGNVSTFSHACGDKNSTVEMTMPVVDKVNEHAYCHVTEKSEDEKGVRFSVMIKRLDDIDELRNCIKPVKAIKIDVEGHELYVLAGAANLIKKSKPLIYCEVQKDNRKAVFDFMKSLDYKIMMYASQKLIPVASDKDLPGDFFFIPN